MNKYTQNHLTEVQEGKRFQFGKNWQSFLSVLNEERIIQAETSIKNFLGLDSLEDLTFLDIGSGSGIFSLAAHRLGAKVHSFDYDTQSFECTKELKKRYFDNDENWVIEQGSVLDEEYMESFKEFDIVYSWGVLHHTGNMWKALDNASRPVSKDGLLFISIYNDQGGWSNRWKLIKRIYNKLPNLLKPLFGGLIMLPRELMFLSMSALRGKLYQYYREIKNYSKVSQRGMSYWHDLIDWVGGYPFEVAKPEEICHFFIDKGFSLKTMSTKGGDIACNEYVFVKGCVNNI